MTEAEIVMLAATTALETYSAEQERNRQWAFDNRLQNTKLLLENYRSIKASVAEAVIYAEDSEITLEVLKELMVGKETFFSDSIRRSTAKSTLLLDHLNAMLMVYRERCERSTDPTATRRWQIIQARYIDEKEMTTAELAEQHYISERQVYNELKKGYGELAVLIFGVTVLGLI